VVGTEDEDTKEEGDCGEGIEGEGWMRGGGE
jgi:hypothetical protein